MRPDFSVYDDMGEEIIVVDRDLRLVYANRAFLSHTGNDRGEVVGKKCFELVHVEECEKESHPCPSREVFLKGTSHGSFHTHRDAVGNPRHLEILSSPIREGEEISYAVEVFRDVTAQTLAERRLSAFIASSPDGIFTSDANGMLVSVNPAYLAIFGYHNDSEIVGKSAAETVWAHPQERDDFIAELSERGFVQDREALLKKADGTTFIGSVSSVMRRDESGAVIGIEGTLRDMTPRKKMEVALTKRNRELGIIARIASLMNQSEDLPPLLERCIGEVCSGLEMQSGFVALFDESGSVTKKIYHGFPLVLIDFFEKGGDLPLLESVRKEGGPSVADFTHAPSITQNPLFQKEGIASGAGILLRTGPSSVGSFFLFGKGPLPDKETLGVLLPVSTFLASGIQKISYLDKIKVISEGLGKLVEEKSRRTKALLESTYALQHTTSWQLGLKTIVESITSGFGFDNTYVFLINERKGVMQCEASLSSYADLAETEIPLNDTDYIAVQCMREKKPINIKDAFEDPRVKKQAGYTTQAFAWVPIIFQNEVLGAFTVDNKDSGKPITGEDIDTLILFANAAASFIEKTRIFFIPATEKQLLGKMKYALARSEGYIVFEEKPDKAFEIFVEAITHGIQGFCVTRTFPSKLKSRYQLTHTPILWLSSAQTQESISPTDLGKLVHIITEFLHRAEDSIIFLEGLEYLITENDFLRIMKMLHSLIDEINVSGSRLLLSLNPRTLTEKEMGILKKEFTSL